jgi:hypothetical protein
MAHAPRKLSFHLEVKMLKIIPADTETQYRQVRELLTEYIAWDAAQLGQLGLDASRPGPLFASGKEDLPGAVGDDHIPRQSDCAVLCSRIPNLPYYTIPVNFRKITSLDLLATI